MQMNVGYNYTGYQMVEQRSSGKGPYTINVSIFGKTDHGSILDDFDISTIESFHL